MARLLLRIRVLPASKGEVIMHKFRWMPRLRGPGKWAIAFVALALGAPAAHADVFTYTIGVPNTALATKTGPYATVTVDRTSSTTATITFDSLINGGYIYLMGSENSADVNVNATSWTLNNVTGTALPGFSGPSLSDTEDKQVDGFGDFNQTLKEFDGFQYSLDEISFTLTDNSGSWGSAADVLTANAAGYLAAIHAFPCSEAGAGCTNQQNNIQTGYAANGTVPSPVSEPAGLSVLGVGLLGLGLARRRKAA
jgi:hypothetical protein